MPTKRCPFHALSRLVRPSDPAETTPLATKASAPATERTTLSQCLKARTRARHDEAEHHPFHAVLSGPSASLSAYRTMLGQMLHVHGILDPLLRAQAATTDTFRALVHEQHLHEAALRDDLAFLRAQLDEVLPLPATRRFGEMVARTGLSDPPALLGVFYVLEGSTNGGSVIAKRLREAHGWIDERGTRFINPHGTHVRQVWSRWKNALDALDFDAATQERIILAAEATFAAMIDICGELHAACVLSSSLDSTHASSEMPTAHHDGDAPPPRDGTAVLLVCHGSHSPAWRGMFHDVHSQVSHELLKLPAVAGVRTAFMEYTEPSIASQLRALDAAGAKRVLVVPLLLTVSNHSSRDIPAICGQDTDEAHLAELARERIEVYDARADVDFAPLLDFPGIARISMERRLRDQVARAAHERLGVVLVGYGSEEHSAEWESLFAGLCERARGDLGFDTATHAWCGHVVRYAQEPVVEAVDRLFDQGMDRVVVLPMLVAYDEMFQDRIIGGAISRTSQPERVVYHRDAILPEPAVLRWIVDVARERLV